MDEIIKIVKDIDEKRIKPVYFLMGDEPYYIDKLSDYIEKNILSEEEKGFNQTVLYGRDIEVEDIISTCKRYPMMADYQVVIVKEAQDLARSIAKLESYVLNPTPSTVLVVCYKYKTLDKRTTFSKSIPKTGLLFESKKLYDTALPQWLKRVLSGKKLDIEPKASAMLIEFLGNDLSKISNEIDKLAIILPKGTTVTPEIIEKNIGFSKDFNVFEFQKAIGSRNVPKSYAIAYYFHENPKDHNFIMVTSLLFSFFSKLLQYHGLKDKSPKNVATALKVNPYHLTDYDVALKNYPMRKVSQIVATLRDVDVKSKGVGASFNDRELYKTLLTSIFS
ncbi:DNA polymerase III subunit delta [Flavobacterium tegetincola]|uniref:DNA polymerase III subunit delta n=1 Tax=Flavobacterium tegetincola TaxID=150172 RepID=UPI00041426B1|nr:DNA polymerase III subunit delta [Flavobacterium tegetincola]